MTFREESERMFAGVLVAAVLHGALLIGAHKLFDLRFEDYTRPLTVRLLAPEARAAPVREQRPLPPKQEEAAPAVAVPKPAPEQVATPRPAAQAQPAPERAIAQEPAPVRTPPRTESAPAEASAGPGPVAAWTPTLRQSVESASVPGGGGLSAVTGDTVRQAEPRAGAATSAPAPSATQGDLPATFKEGLALPVEESVFARSASSPTTGGSAARGLSSDDSVPVVRNPGLSGRKPDTTAALAPVSVRGTPTARKADAPGTAATEPAAPLADSAPQVAARRPPVEATVSGGAAAAPSEDTVGVGSRLGELDQALDASGHDTTAIAGADRGASSAADGVAGPAASDVRLPEGWDVSGSLGQRRLLDAEVPALERYLVEIVRETVRVRICASSSGRVSFESFERASASTEINAKIREALRGWRYEPAQSQDPVCGVVTIQISIRTRSAEVAVSGQ